MIWYVNESLPLTDMWYRNGRVESLPLTNMRYISGWVVSLSFAARRRAFFYREGGTNEKNGILFIKEYTIAGNHLMLTSEHTAKAIEQKARKVLGMLKRGVKFTPTQPDVMEILKKLQQEK